MQPLTQAIVSLSGGADSATVLAIALKDHEPKNILAVKFKYGSKHNPLESFAADTLGVHYGVRVKEIDVSGVFAGMEAALLNKSKEVPEGHYEDESMRLTVVPGRNIVFVAALAAQAMSVGAKKIYLGVHAGDHFIYPDCRPRFIGHMGMAVWEGTNWKGVADDGVTLATPLLYMAKNQIIAQGLSLGVPYHLTRTCYTAHPVACGRCGSCVERQEAFAKNGAVDPIEYQYRGPLPEKSS